jgi:hypothetical protein
LERPLSKEKHRRIITFNLVIVTLSKNDPLGLLRTYQSLASSLDSVTWLIVYPGSSDPSHSFIITLLKRHPEIVTLEDSGNGIYPAMNLAISRLSDEKWVWFLNGGDVMAHKEVLSSVRDQIKTSRTRWFYGKHSVATSKFSYTGNPKVMTSFSIHKQLYARNYVSHQATIMKVDLLKDLDCFNENFEIAADWDLLVRASKLETPEYLNLHIATFYLGGHSSQFRAKGNCELFKLRQVHLSRNFVNRSYSFLWYLTRSIRNSSVLLLEKYSPRFLHLMRKIRWEYFG